MGLRCKPGDLAVCIEGSAVGTFVTVKERGTDHPHSRLPSWICIVATPTRVTLVDARTNRKIRHETAAAGSPVQFLDRELQPIRPQPAPITTSIPDDITETV